MTSGLRDHLLKAAAAAALLWAWPASTGLAQEVLADLAAFRAGCQALADERFGTAAERFRECWSLLSDREEGGPEESFVAARLVESLVRNGDAAGAVAWLSANARFRPGPKASFWIAVALETEGRFSEAAEHYRRRLSSEDPPSPDTRIARAYCLARSGEAAEAWDLVEDLSNAPDLAPASALRLAGVAEAASRDAEALDLAAGIDADDPSSPGLRLPLARLRARILKRADRLPEALAEVYGALETPADEDEARRAFLLLEAILANSPAPPDDLAAKLDAWSGEPAHPGREAAKLFKIALLAEGADREQRLSAFAEASGSASLVAEALLRTSAGAPSSATLPRELRDRVEFASAKKAFLSGDFRKARLVSEKARERSGEGPVRGLYNAAVSSLRAGDAESFLSLEEELRNLHPRSSLSTRLSYLAGLVLANQGAPAAFERLSQFVRDHPDDPAHSEALLALAELHLNQAPARPSEAHEIFATLRSRSLDLAQSERLDYDEVWAARIEGGGGRLLRRARDFATNWPNSPHLPEILMILGFEHASRQGASEAAEAFARVAEEFEGSPLAPTARFLEAKSTPSGAGAEEKWRRIVGAGNDHADEARHELALLLLSLDRFEEAKAELEGLLDRMTAESPLRHAALADLGHTSYLEALARGNDASCLELAANQFAALSSLTEASPFWRFNAAVRRGKCLEAMGKDSVALEIYRSIVDESRIDGGASAAPDPEASEWVFRAGFAAIGLLEEQKNWPAAIEVADALSEKGGPRAVEAARLAQRLRLRHWIWN